MPCHAVANYCPHIRHYHTLLLLLLCYGVYSYVGIRFRFWGVSLYKCGWIDDGECVNAGRVSCTLTHAHTNTHMKPYGSIMCVHAYDNTHFPPKSPRRGPRRLNLNYTLDISLTYVRTHIGMSVSMCACSWRNTTRCFSMYHHHHHHSSSSPSYLCPIPDERCV